MKRLVSGLQPSGELTIGNYCGGIKQFLKYQDEYESYIFVPDMHSITVDQDPKVLQERVRRFVGLYLACGLDPDKCIIYIQSENLYHANLAWILGCNSYMGEMARMTQFKDKSKKQSNINCGLFTYPILMAADILLYDADVVPTGTDQRQHVELARDIAQRFNNKYGSTFVVPESIIPTVGAKLKDLQEPTKKMSKSNPNEKGVIFLLDDEVTIRKKVMGAVTDNDNKIFFDEKNKPGISNLLTIYSAFSDLSISEVAEMFKDNNYGELKKSVADLLVEKLLLIQEKYDKIMNYGLVDEALDRGKTICNKIASEKYAYISQLVGFGRGKQTSQSDA